VVDPKRIIGKKWRAKEKERHKGSLTPKKSKSENIHMGKKCPRYECPSFPSTIFHVQFWGAHTLGTSSPSLFTFHGLILLLGFRFLWWH
jgi:hypothetical protein